METLENVCFNLAWIIPLAVFTFAIFLDGCTAVTVTITIILSIGLIIAGVVIDTHLDKTDPTRISAQQKRDREKIERRRREETPHVIREADGCRVYTFLSGEKYHYFTRCKDLVTTEAHYEECHTENRTTGKMTQVVKVCEDKSETIETMGK